MTEGLVGNHPADPRHSWLPDLGSNQGPTDCHPPSHPQRCVSTDGELFASDDRML